MATLKDFNNIVHTLDIVLESMKSAGHPQVVLSLSDLLRAAKTTNLPKRKMFDEVSDALTINDIASMYGTVVCAEVEGDIVVLSRVPDMLPRVSWLPDGSMKLLPWNVNQQPTEPVDYGPEEAYEDDGDEEEDEVPMKKSDSLRQPK